METPIRANRSGVVTIPFAVVGTPEPDLHAMLRALGVRLPKG